jgi:nicotinamidase-related amidase
MGTATTQEGSVLVDYDGSTALVVVDVQNDFADPKGSLYVAEGERVVPLVNREIGRALVAGTLVVTPRIGIPPRRRTSSRAGVSGPSIASSTAGVPSCTRTCGSLARSSARGRRARTATRASPSAIR